MSTRRELTVGELLDKMLPGPGAAVATVVSETDRARIIAMPPEVFADPVKGVFRIKLTDGSNLNLHVRVE